MTKQTHSLSHLLTLVILVAALTLTGAAQSSIGNNLDHGNTLPTTCRIGQTYFLLATQGANAIGVYQCATANTWTSAGGATTGSGAPVGSCSASQLYVDTATGKLYACTAGSWVLVGAGSAPGGTAGGDLGGTFPNPTVVALLNSPQFKVNSVNESAGAVTCDLSLGYICKIVQTTNPNPLTITVTNLPTNQPVQIYVDTATNSKNQGLTTWSNNVWCRGTSAGQVDTAVQCNLEGSTIGYRVNSGIYEIDGFSDGTKLWLQGQSGKFQVASASHVNAAIIGLTNGANGAIGINSTGGQYIIWNSAGASALKPSVSLCGTGATIQAFGSDTLFTITAGTTSSSSCTITLKSPGGAYARQLGAVCGYNVKNVASLALVANTSNTTAGTPTIVVTGFSDSDVFTCWTGMN